MVLEHLETERLKFRRLSHSDKPALLEYFTDKKSTAFLDIPTNIEHFTENWIERQLKRYANFNSGLYAVELKETGQMIGQCGLVWQFVDSIPKWEVGYHFFRQYWGNGYATEAAQACKNYCFENEMAETLIALIHPDNIKSIQVAQRNEMDFWKETIFKKQSLHVYRARREDWEKTMAISEVNKSNN